MDSLDAAILEIETGIPAATVLREFVRWAKLFDLELDRLEGKTRGIDLNKYYKDVRRLTGKMAFHACAKHGWEFEDLIAEVALAIQVRNKGTCPWDPAKSAVSTYICRCVTQVISRRIQNRRCRPQLTSTTFTCLETGEVLDAYDAHGAEDGADARLIVQQQWEQLIEKYGPHCVQRVLGAQNKAEVPELSTGKYTAARRAVRAALHA